MIDLLVLVPLECNSNTNTKQDAPITFSFNFKNVFSFTTIVCID